MTAILTKDAILNSKDVDVEFVEVPEWGGQVGIKQMSGVERDLFEQETIKRSRGNAQLAAQMDIKGLKCFLLALTMCDENGTLLFPEEEDVKALNKKNGKVIDRLFQKCQEINKLTEKSLEESEKN